MNDTSAPTADELGSSAQRERRERILDATIALASQGGFDAVQTPRRCLPSRAIQGATPADRVITVLRRTTRDLQGDPHLTEALVRAFMFADRTVAQEIHSVGLLLTRMLTRAMHPDLDKVCDEDIATARVVGDVWFAALVSCVNGRRTSAETVAHMEHAVRLIVR